MSYRDPDACAAIGRIRDRNPDVPQRELARQIYGADFDRCTDIDDSCEVSIYDSVASTYARLRRYDVKRRARLIVRSRSRIE